MRTSSRIAIDVRMVHDSGIGTYIRNLVPRIATARPDWHLELLGPRAALEALGWHELPNVELRDCQSRIYTLGEQWELPRALPHQVDLFWSPHYNIPLLHRGPLVVTVHDVFHLAMRDHVPGLVRRGYARSMFEAVRRRARGILFVSDFSRREYERLVGRGVADVAVVHNGVGGDWGLDRERLVPPHDRPYVVYVGNVKPHKNLGRLVQAFGSIRDHVPHDLVIVGRREGMRTTDGAVERDAAALGTRVRFTGRVPADELRRWVACADALVLPSLYEGFGLPPLEAMAAGCPTIVSRAGSLPEVCGDASHYCDPYDAASIAGALREVLGDEALRARLRERGRAHAARFTWDACAGRTIEALERAAVPAAVRRAS